MQPQDLNLTCQVISHQRYLFLRVPAERLPNGNTLISEGAPGRIFEVTHNKEIVWEYINPFRSNGGGGGGGNAANSVFRAHRYGPDHPGLRDRDLDPSRYANINRIYGGS